MLTFALHYPQAHCHYEVLNTTNDSSEAFSVSDGEIQVQDPEKLQRYHVLKLTDENRLCNHSYLDVKVTYCILSVWPLCLYAFRFSYLRLILKNKIIN